MKNALWGFELSISNCYVGICCPRRGQIIVARCLHPKEQIFVDDLQNRFGKYRKHHPADLNGV
jgi:hypothetical protein